MSDLRILTPQELARLEPRQQWEYLALLEQRPVPLTQGMFPEQRAFVESAARKMVLYCTRRAAKTYSIGQLLVKRALENPGSLSLYLGMTQDTAWDAIGEPVFRVLNRVHKLKSVFHLSKPRAISLGNRSWIRVIGVDNLEDEKEKLRGKKLATVACDEVQSFTIDLDELVYAVLVPATVDLGGVVVLAGTPGNNKGSTRMFPPEQNRKGLFFELTQGNDASSPGTWQREGWSCHRWSTFQNPYNAARWATEIEELKRDRPGIEETPLFQQEYMGRWTTDTAALVYQFSRDRNIAAELPHVPGRWHHVLGMDLGWNDLSAFVVLAWHEAFKDVFVREATGGPRMYTDDVVREIERLQAKYIPDEMVCDPASKQVVEDLRRRFRQPIQSAEKQDKAKWIGTMNGDLVTGRVKVLPEAERLADQWGGLIRDPRRPDEIVEHPAIHNDLADAALYAYRKCYAYLHKPKAAEVPAADRLKAAAIRRSVAEAQMGYYAGFER